MNPLNAFIHNDRIAYFSMEIALRDDIPTYNGGLGVLAGDTLRTAADLELPLVGVTLVSRQGYFRQTINENGQQQEQPEPWQPQSTLQPLEAKIAVPIAGHDVWVQGWLYTLTGGTGYKIPVILLDTDLTENSEENREITHYLYGRDETYRLKQEIVLGIGGARLLQALGFRVHTYHMNEGHSALLSLELLNRYENAPEDVGAGESVYDTSEVRKRCLFTTHTPVEAGHDKYSYDLVKELLDDFVDLSELQRLAGKSNLNMTCLALNLSGYVNGVAKSHAHTSNSMFPGYRVHAITNGIHPSTWASSGFAKLYDKHIPEWRLEPERLLNADQIANDEILVAHQQAKDLLIQLVKDSSNIQLDPAIPIIGFARRMTAYKRPDLLFSNIEKLKQIATDHPFQIVLAGKAHPRDTSGKELIALLHQHIKQLQANIKIVYLPDYNMRVAKTLIAGADIWLNTPLRPLEASGTSGMKAAINGVPNLSVLDGWWMEGCIEGVTGWPIGSSNLGNSHNIDADSLYEKLHNIVLPLYYNDQSGWIQIMKGAIAKNASYFNSHRMMRRYASEAYIR